MASSFDPAGPPEQAGPPVYEGEDADARSLLEDVHALINDGKTYLQAEVQFQKTQASFVASGAKGVLAFGVVAVAFVHLALIGLTVGLIIALEPHVGGWWATAIVVGVLLLGAALLAWSAARKWTSMMKALRGEPREKA